MIMAKKINITIIANGENPEKKALDSALKNCDMIIAADGGSRFCQKNNITPDIIVGDLDSSTHDLQSIFPHTRIIEMQDQNYSDIEKAVQTALTFSPKKIDVLAVTGKRSDHMLANILFLQKFYLLHNEVDICIYDNWGKLRFLKPGKHKIKAETGKTVSFFSLCSFEKLSLHGFKYELENYKNDDSFYGISNVYSESFAYVEFKGKVLIWYECY